MLTEMQQSFVINYVRNGYNAYKAAIDAGYSTNFAKTKIKTLTLHPEISKKINYAYKVVERETIDKICMSVKDRVKVLDRIIRAVVPLDDNEPVNINHAEKAIKAVSELNKMFGDYAPERKLSLTMDATKNKLIEIRKEYEEY